MELVTGFSNPSRLDAINTKALDSADSVEAAIAYISDENTLIRRCFDLDIQLKLYARYDYTQPVAVDILERFLHKRSPNFIFKFVPDILHSKVIWWHGVGAYVGSANLSRRAWFGNIEAGVYLDESELLAQDLQQEIERFFDQIELYAHPLTAELLTEVEKFTFKDPLQSQLTLGEKRFNQERLLPKLESLISITHKPAVDRRRADFLREWNSTIETLRLIAARVAAHRPNWIAPDVPPGAQADQFLHAYYYQQVKDGPSHPFRVFHQRNKANPEKALLETIRWWEHLKQSPGSEDQMLHTWLPLLQTNLAADKVRQLSRDEFIDVATHVHAMREHANRIDWKSYGLDAPLPKMGWEQRARYFGNWLYDQRSAAGTSVLDTLDYVLYGGQLNQTPERIFEAAYEPRSKIPHLGVSALGEIVGWVHPDYSPPRNGRTSKALVALGFDVRVHSE